MGPDSCQGCPVTGQGTPVTNWNPWISIWIWGKASLLWGWQSTGIGCSERLWSLLPWRYSTLPWMWSCSACSSWTCFNSGVEVISRVPFQPQLSSNSVWFASLGQLWVSSHGKKGVEEGPPASACCFPPACQAEARRKHGRENNLPCICRCYRCLSQGTNCQPKSQCVPGFAFCSRYTISLSEQRILSCKELGRLARLKVVDRI